MRMKVRIEGTDQIAKNLKAMGAALRRETLVAIISEELEPMAEQMRALAARGTGEMADSVTVSTELSPAQAASNEPIAEIEVYAGPGPLSRVLMMVGSRLLGLAGPVGLAVSAFLLFKDHIIAALAIVWSEITATLGPPIEAIMAKFEAIWAKLSGGSVGSAISGLMSLLGGLRDFIGTGLQAAIVVSGEVIERMLAAIVAAFSGLVDVVSGVVDLISALLSGDFAGAWNALVGIVESVFGAIVDIAAAFVPELGSELQQVTASLI